MTHAKYPMTREGHYLAYHDHIDRERRNHLSLFPEPNRWAQFSSEQIKAIAERLSGRTLWLPKEELIRRIEERKQIQKQRSGAGSARVKGE